MAKFFRGWSTKMPTSTPSRPGTSARKPHFRAHHELSDDSLRCWQSRTVPIGGYVFRPLHRELSYMFSLAARVLGYKPAIAPLVGVAAACVTVALMFLVGGMQS